MKYLSILAFAFLQISSPGELIGEALTDPAVVSLTVPKGTFSGYSVFISDHCICESFVKLHSEHKFEVTKIGSNDLNFKWGAKSSFIPHFSSPVRLVAKPTDFALSKGRLSAVVGYVTINGVDEEIRLALAK